MNEKIKALYLYCCDGSLPYESYYGVRDGLFLSLYEKYRTLKGRFWCNHNWQLFVSFHKVIHMLLKVEQNVYAQNVERLAEEPHIKKTIGL